MDAMEAEATYLSRIPTNIQQEITKAKYWVKKKQYYIMVEDIGVEMGT